MGRNPTGDRKYVLESVWNLHKEIVRLSVLGMKNVDIAEELGITPVTVSYTLNSPVVQREVANLEAARDLDAVDIGKRIQEVAPKALQVLEDLLDEDLAPIRYRAAADILDRAGHAAVKTIRTANVHAFLSREDIEDIKQRAREIGVIDISHQLVSEGA